MGRSPTLAPARALRPGGGAARARSSRRGREGCSTGRGRRPCRRGAAPSTSGEMSGRLAGAIREGETPSQQRANTPRPMPVRPSPWPERMRPAHVTSLGCRDAGRPRSSLSAVALGLQPCYGWIEAGWLRTRVVDVPIHGLPRRSGRVADRAPLRLPPRRSALARQQRERARGALGRASAGPTSSASPETSSPTRVVSAAALAARAPRAPARRPRQPRRGRHARSLLAGRRAPGSRARAPSPRRGRDTSIASWRAVVVVGVDPETYRRDEAPARTISTRGGRCALLLCHFPGIVRADPAAVVRPDPLRPSPRRSDLPAAPGSPDHARAPAGDGSSRASTRRRQARCTSRRERARRSSRSGSSRAPR